MLDAVGELREDVVGDVGGGLRHEEDADALRADELDDLNYLLHERLRRVREEEVRLVEEEYDARLFDVADLGELLEELRHQPEQERRIDGRAVDEAGAGQDVDISAPVEVRPHPVAYVEFRLAEEPLAALGLEGQQRALNGTYARGGDVAVHRRELGAVVAHVLEHRA